ncbi:MAG: hypothetical protein R8P61_05020 [Bacteroidia bacterium]|nr:hypothetical protein [Bacteroidia bacterium]
MKRYTWRVVGEEEVLVSSFERNEQDKTETEILYKPGGIEEMTIKTFNDLGLQVAEQLFENDQLLEESTSTYDGQGRPLEESLLFEGEVYQKVVFSYAANGNTKTVYVEEEETEKQVHQDFELGYSKEFFQHGELVQKLHCQKSPDQRIFDIEIQDVEGNVVEKERHEFDPKAKLLKESTFSPEGALLEENQYIYRNELLIKIESRGASQQVLSETTFEYNRLGKQTKMETRNSSGDLLAFNVKDYDEKGREIEQRAFSAANSYSNTSEVHFVFTYEDE